VSSPLFLWGLSLVPLLAAIYLLRQRVRPLPVSSLLLWRQQRPSPEGGLRIRKLRTPLLFFLELAALGLLVLAAAEPLMGRSRLRRPAVFVLDDSLSMRAGGADSPRLRAEAALRSELGRAGHQPIRLVLAGPEPQSLGPAAPSAAEALAQLSGWRAGQPSAALLEAALFARQLAGPRARLVVLTDQPPPARPGEEPLEWWAFGRALPNAAFVNAARLTSEKRERLLLEVGAYAAQPLETELTVESADTHQSLAKSRLRLAPGERRRLFLELPQGSGAVRARLSPDALAGDGEAVLLPQRASPIRVEVRLADAELRAAVVKALAATSRAELTARDPQLVIGSATADVNAWTLDVRSEKGASSFAGPFVVDRRHPLTAGLALDGVVWAARPQPLPGAAVVAAGNVTLLADRESAGLRHDLTLQLAPKLSTLQETPAWPALFWNLLAWRAASLPGPREVNARLGTEVPVTLPRGAGEMVVVDPEGRRSTVRAEDQQAPFHAGAPGLHLLEAGAERWSVAVNALVPEESDLTRCASGRWGESSGAPGDARERESGAWMLLLAALAVLAAHRALAARQPALPPRTAAA